MLFEKKKKVNLKIDGMHCQNCAAKVTNALKAIGGNADIDLKLGRATLTCPEKLDNESIVKAVEALGFTCEVL